MLDNAHPVIGGIYRVIEKITAEIPITNIAYNRNTNDIVGFFVVKFRQIESTEHVRQLLQQIEMCRSVNLPQVINR